MLTNEETYYQKLCEAISALLKNILTPVHERFLLTFAHALATNILRIKFSHSPSIKQYIGLHERDLAYDCIAELFEHDDKGQLIHFKTYFSNFDPEALSQKETLVHFRRLVSSAVNQNLMHVYRDFDPSLGKIIRNIKLAIAAHKTFEEIDRFDEICIAPIHCELNEHLPTADIDFLFSLLQLHVRGDEFIPELLSLFSRCVRKQNEYCRITPIISLALTFRALFIVKQAPQTPSSSAEDHRIETLETIEKSINQVKSSIVLRNNGKVRYNPESIDAYFNTIHSVLLAKINETNGSADSLFEGLKEHFQQLNKNEYKKFHRTKLEYYYKLCREVIAAELINPPSRFGKQS
ncbi:MAG: hypothetical protein WCX28_13860 [Bacteriovoracaceae bacterium]|nr:hypothetical protein [Bacteroidota bacterium]